MKEKPSLSDMMRIWFKWFLEPVARFFNRLGIYPNTMTLIGLAGTTCCGALIALGYMTWAGLLLLVMGPVDVLDGTMARLRGEASEWGAFVDSVSDRYGELVIFLGFIIFYLGQDNTLAVLLAYLAAGGSVLVSYVRARAEAVGFEAKVGILTRTERYLVLIPLLVFNFPLAALLIVAIFANFTALQRIVRVRREVRRRQSQS